MSNPEENLSAQQSLDLITNMIRQAQGRVSGNSFYFLLWGWCIAAANFGMYGLMRFTDYPYPYMVWLITIPAWIITMIYGMKQGKELPRQTHLDRINMWLWIGMGIGILPICLFGSVLNWNINPIVLLMAAPPTFIAGIIIRFRPLLLGGISFWIAGTISFLVPQQEQYLVGGIAIILGYLMPGYLLRNLKEK
jgi:hypothetical protein